MSACQYVTPLPFNGKQEFLLSNERIARARTRNQQVIMLRSPDYMKGGVEAFQKMVDIHAIEKVELGEDIEGEEETIICYLP